MISTQISSFESITPAIIAHTGLFKREPPLGGGKRTEDGPLHQDEGHHGRVPWPTGGEAWGLRG